MQINEKKIGNLRSYFVLKRLFDIFFSLFLFILTLPIVVVSIIFILIESPGNPLYLQKRVGKNHEEFNIIKLRSMRKDAEKNGAKWATRDDCRITRVGKFIRKTRIDELPQLINVIKGDMSIIGPRPERRIFIEEFLIEIPNFNDRLTILPGLTGWAQVNGGYDISPKEKLDLDMYYINNLGVKMDLLILIKTIKIVISGEGAR